MSYGKFAGEPYISNLTFAFLEDTGHYRMNYNGTGRLVKDLEVTGQCGEDVNTDYLDFIFGNDQSAYVSATWGAVVRGWKKVCVCAYPSRGCRFCVL
jgi:hypothetical protein